CGEGDVVDASFAGLIGDLDKNLGFGRGCRADNDLRLGVLGVDALDIGAYRANVDAPALEQNVTGFGDVENDILVFYVRRRLVRCWRSVDIDAAFFDKGRCHDEEDQHNKDNVQHGRQVDF